MTRLEDIVCFECGSGAEPWRGSAELLGQDMDVLLHLAGSSLLQVERVGDRVRVSGVDRVGLVLLPSGRRVIIRSKVPSLVTLEWLAFLGEFPPLEMWLHEPAVTTGEDLYACIGRLFVQELERVTRRFLRKDFTPVRRCSSTLRGKVLMTPLCRSMHRLPDMPQICRTRTLDTAYNVVLALALDKCPLLLAGESWAQRRAVAHLTDAWAHVSREVNDVVSVVTEAQWASPPGYRSALQLARLILLGASLDPTSGAGGQVFTLSLAAIWENSLRRMFGDVEDSTGWALLAPSDRTRRWNDATGKTDKTRWMTADVLLERNGIRWVLDAKYKLGFGDESRDDRFQMCAYALGFSADRATLVYPTGNCRSTTVRFLLSASVGNRDITVESIELPMAMGPEACKEAIRSVCDRASEEEIQIGRCCAADSD